MCVVHIQNIAYLDINSTRSQKVNRNANVSVSMARSALGKHELNIMYDVHWPNNMDHACLAIGRYHQRGTVVH